MLTNGKWFFADKFLNIMLLEKGYKSLETEPYHPTGDVIIKYDPKTPFTNYSRTLDFTTGEITIAWKEGSARYQRQTFVSRTHDLVCIRLHSEGTVLNGSISLQPHKLKKGKKVPITFKTGRIKTSYF